MEMLAKTERKRLKTISATCNSCLWL